VEGPEIMLSLSLEKEHEKMKSKSMAIILIRDNHKEITDCCALGSWFEATALKEFQRLDPLRQGGNSG